MSDCHIYIGSPVYTQPTSAPPPPSILWKVVLLAITGLILLIIIGIIIFIIWRRLTEKREIGYQLIDPINDYNSFDENQEQKLIY